VSHQSQRLIDGMPVVGLPAEYHKTCALPIGKTVCGKGGLPMLSRSVYWWVEMRKSSCSAPFQADEQDDLHAEVVKECSQLGYHILCEKPMATRVSDCVQMVQDIQAQSGLIFGMGHGESPSLTVGPTGRR
jgi:hypothetical protein